MCQSIAEVDSPLKKHQWKNRIVIINEDEASFKAFQENKFGISDRQLILISIQNETLKSFPSTPGLNPQSIMTYYQLIPGQPEVILIGKDGGIKRRSQELKVEEIFTLIDGMPMRKYEMGRKRRT